jgi:hypothetical protein
MDENHSSSCARPAGAFLSIIALAAGLAALGTGPIETAYGQTGANPMRPIPIPAQVPAKDGVAQIPDTRLWYWDTGGQGVPIVLLHPATGSALIWGYQQPVLRRPVTASSPIRDAAITIPRPSTGTILALAPRTLSTSRMSWALDDFMWWRRRLAAASRRTSRSPTRTGL